MHETVRAKKALGQHFLVAHRYCERIVDLASIEAANLVIEIGPGTGHLTEHLLERDCVVLAVEVDPEMIEALQRRFAKPLAEHRLSILRADILAVDWEELLLAAEAETATLSPEGPTVTVVGNLPYNIATRIIQRTTVCASRFQVLVFMTQKEVAQRVLAAPGGRDNGYLAVWLEYFYHRRKGFDVPAGAFRPPPKVTSHVFSLIPRERPIEEVEPEALGRLLRASFSHRRKTLWNNLSRAFHDTSLLDRAFGAAGLDRTIRPEQVGLPQFLCMTRVLSFAV